MRSRGSRGRVGWEGPPAGQAGGPFRRSRSGGPSHLAYRQNRGLGSRSVRWLLALLLLAACSGSSDVHVTGTVTTFGTFGACPTAGPKVTFRDGDSTVIGTVQADDAAPPGPEAVCHTEAPFAIDLPTSEFYVVQVGTTDPLAPMSYDELAAQDFRLELEVT